MQPPTQANFFIHFSKLFPSFCLLGGPGWPSSQNHTYHLLTHPFPKDTKKPWGHSYIIKHWVKTLNSPPKKCFIIIKSENRLVLLSLCNAKHLCYLKLVTRLHDVCVHPSCLFWPWGENKYLLSLLCITCSLYSLFKHLLPPASVFAFSRSRVRTKSFHS